MALAVGWLAVVAVVCVSGSGGYLHTRHEVDVLIRSDTQDYGLRVRETIENLAVFEGRSAWTIAQEMLRGEKP